MNNLDALRAQMDLRIREAASETNDLFPEPTAEMARATLDYLNGAVTALAIDWCNYFFTVGMYVGADDDLAGMGLPESIEKAHRAMEEDGFFAPGAGPKPSAAA